MKKEYQHDIDPEATFRKWMGLKPRNEHISDLNIIKNHLSLHSSNMGFNVSTTLDKSYFTAEIFKRNSTLLTLRAEVTPANTEVTLFTVFRTFESPVLSMQTPEVARDSLALTFKENDVFAVCGDTQPGDKNPMSALFIPFYLKSREIVKVLSLYFDKSLNPEKTFDTFWYFKKPTFNEKANYEMAALGFGSFIIKNGLS